MAQCNPLPASPSHLPHSWHSHACSNPCFLPSHSQRPLPLENRVSRHHVLCNPLRQLTPPLTITPSPPKGCQLPTLMQIYSYICRIISSGIWLWVNLLSSHAFQHDIPISSSFSVLLKVEGTITHTPSTSTHIHTSPLSFVRRCSLTVPSVCTGD
jgi:hypothetical protein